MNMALIKTSLATLATLSGMATQTLAQSLPIVGAPVAGGTGFQTGGTEIAREIHDLDFLLLVIIAVIVVFVTGLLLYVVARYNERANPTPSTFTHNSPLEVAWTVVPIIVLVFIGAFSLPVLFKQVEIPETDLTIKVTGNQWYWSYEYPDDGVGFDSFMIGSPSLGGDLTLTAEAEAELIAAGYSRDEFLLATDTAMVIPSGQNIKIIVTGSDVLHAWMVPGLGMQHSAVPGRLGEMWFNADKEGIYFGQCTTLCGALHAYMPITVKVVSPAVYAQWLTQAQAGDVILTAADAEAFSAVKVAANN
jgi:cytochrome c oxidase subunit 2